MRTIRKIALPVMAFLVMGLASCNKDEAINYSTKSLKNTELMDILKKRGFAFDKDGKLELNDLAEKTTTLDLSGTKLKDLSGLDILPNLKEVKLSKNDYKLSFDFSQLPSQITGVDLTGNEIYEFTGLTKEDETGNITILHHLNKLYLPNSAKYNEDEIVNFFTTAKDVDMQMSDEKGTLQKYNTLREVPDEVLRKGMKEVFPSIFTGDKVDIAKRIVNPEEAVMPTAFMEADINNFEGLQYIIHNKGWRGTTVVTYTESEKEFTTSIPYLKIPKTVQGLILTNVSTPNGIDISACTDLMKVSINDNPSLKELDFSMVKAWGQRGYQTEIASEGMSYMEIVNCANLEKITLPKEAKHTSTLSFIALPNLKELNFANFAFVPNMDLYDLPKCKITYPTNKLEEHTVTMPNGTTEKKEAIFTISKELFDATNAKEYVMKNKGTLRSGTSFSCMNSVLDKMARKMKAYDWSKDY